MSNKPILIVGSQGKTGRRVEAKLKAAGQTTRGVSRSTEIPFDWSAPQSWPAALCDVSAAYLTYHPDLSVPEAANHIATFAAMAIDAGIQHIVLLSGRGEEGAAAAEQALRNSGIAWNIVQASWFAQNFSEDFMQDGISRGEVVLPYCEAQEPFVDIDDIADVVVASLMEPGLRNRLFEVTGPRLMTFADCIEAISAEVGHEVTLTEVDLDEYLQVAASQGVPSEMCELLSELFTLLFDGRNARTTDGVREALGRPATDFKEYVRKTVSTGIWQPSKEHS